MRIAWSPLIGIWRALIQEHQSELCVALAVQRLSAPGLALPVNSNLRLCEAITAARLVQLAEVRSQLSIGEGSAMETAEANRRTMQRFVLFINTADEKLASELVSPKASFHVPGRAEPASGPPGYLEIIQMMRSGFPDIQWTLEELIAEGDKVAARFTMRGTHQGTFFGVPPTGKKITVQALNIYRFADGQIVEERGQPDLLELLKQIGAIPAR
jgi:steroid delta-isomerase-like uncharacterized protein